MTLTEQTDAQIIMTYLFQWCHVWIMCNLAVCRTGETVSYGDRLSDAIKGLSVF
jgi:hypothetical protein